jgi:predicted PurR-regulated permease PerM
MTERQTGRRVAAFAIFLFALWLLSEILFPFVAALGLAYLFDPLADRLEKWGLPRWAAAGLITALSVFGVIAVFLLLAPLLHGQFAEFAEKIPHYLDQLRDKATDLLAAVQSQLSESEVAQLKQKLGGAAGSDLVAWIGALLGRVWGGGVALLNLLSLLVITPIVMFYLLRDWDRIVVTVEGWLPRDSRATIREQVEEIDTVLSGFMRGQVSVCLLLGVFYAVGLSLVGLEFGLVIGFVTGLVSFVPYFGMLVGFVVGIGVALAQFGDWQPVAMVAGVFIAGQFLEGNFVTPKLVGDRVGLHPVWIIFGLMAGGVLFGFTGILLAVPATAVIGVLGRFAISRYKTSVAYTGGDGG